MKKRPSPCASPRPRFPLPHPAGRPPPPAYGAFGQVHNNAHKQFRLEKDGHGRDRPPVALFRHFSRIARHSVTRQGRRGGRGQLVGRRGPGRRDCRSGGERGGRRPGGDDALAGGRRVGRPCRHRGGHGRLARGDAPRRGGRPLRTTRSWVRSTSRFTTTSTTTATPPSLPTPTSAPTAKTTTRARRPSTRGSST